MRNDNNLVVELNLTGVRWSFEPPKTSIIEAFNHLNFILWQIKKKFWTGNGFTQFKRHPPYVQALFCHAPPRTGNQPAGYPAADWARWFTKHAQIPSRTATQHNAGNKSAGHAGRNQSVMQQQITLGSLQREYTRDYVGQNRLPQEQRSLVHLLSGCRTSASCSHFEKCDQCGHTEKSCNSCRNRHCPACQQKNKLEWMQNRMTELLPVGYYHLVFPLPHELNPPCLQNKKEVYGLML